MVKAIDFVDRHPPRRRRRNLLSLILISIITLSTVLFFIYFPYPTEEESDSSDDHPDFPTIYITCYEALDNENYSNCVFELDSEESSERIDPLEAEIKIRGETSATYPKKGYRLQLSKGEPLLGMRDDDDWQLFASYYDYTRLKTKLSFNLWRNLLLENNPTAILPRSRYVLLYFNGDYKGLYLLAEKNDRKLLGIDETTATNYTNSSVIFQAKDYTNFTVYEKDRWEQDWPNEDEGFYVKDKILPPLIDFVNNSLNNTFYHPQNGIFANFSEINLIDFFLFNFFMLHGDFWDKNYFIARNSHDSLFYLIPWDFDISFGQNSTTIYDNTSTVIQEEICSKNRLYDRLLYNQTFRQNCTNRWNDLRNNIWSNESISNTISNIYSECRPFVQQDLNLWKQTYNSENYINQLKDWTLDRLEFCDDYFINDFL